MAILQRVFERLRKFESIDGISIGENDKYVVTLQEENYAIKSIVEKLLNEIGLQLKNIDIKNLREQIKGKKNVSIRALFRALWYLRKRILRPLLARGSSAAYQIVNDIEKNDEYRKNKEYICEKYFSFYCEKINGKSHRFFSAQSIIDFFNVYQTYVTFINQIISVLNVVENKKNRTTNCGKALEILNAALRNPIVDSAYVELHEQINEYLEDKNLDILKNAERISEKDIKFISDKVIDSNFPLAKIKRVCEILDNIGVKDIKQYQKIMEKEEVYFSDDAVSELKNEEETIKNIINRGDERTGSVAKAGSLMHDISVIENVLKEYLNQEQNQIIGILKEIRAIFATNALSKKLSKEDYGKCVEIISDYNKPERNVDHVSLNNINKLANSAVNKQLGKVKLWLTIPAIVLLIAVVSIGICSPLIKFNHLGRSFMYSTQSGEFEFRKYDNSGAEIISAVPFVSEEDGKFEFPSQVALDSEGWFDKDVVAIGANVFGEESEKNFTAVFIPKSITHIDSNAFDGCNNITFYCEASEKPDGYEDGWSGYNPIIWGVSIGDEIEEVEYNDMRFILNKGDKTTTFIGLKGAGKESLDIPPEITVGGEDYEVTQIAEKALEDHTELKSVTISDSVASIGYYAFYSCNSLTSIIIPDSVISIGDRAFAACNALTIYCEAKSKPSSWSSNWNYSNCPVIWNCNSNETAEDGNIYYVADNGIRYALNNGAAAVIRQSMTLNGEIIIPEEVTYKDVAYSVTSIENNAFSACSGLTSVIIPNGVTSIGSYAFYYCSSLISITIPDGVTSIGSYVFYNCSNLISIIIPDDVTSIGNYAFNGCNALTIYCEAKSKPSSWSSSWNYSNCPVIWNCNSNETAEDGDIYYVADNGIRYALNNGAAAVIRQFATLSGEIIIPEEITYKDVAYSVTSIVYYAFYGCSGLTSITIPDGVTSIGNSAFSGCSGLTSITIPDSVTSIGRSAFRDCSSLTSIIIPFVGSGSSGNTHFGYIFGASSYSDNSDYVSSTLKEVVITGGISIGEGAFAGCNGLTSITIPDSVTSIGRSAFRDCSSLTSIIIPFVGSGSSGNTHFGYIFGASSYSDNSDYVPSTLKEVIITGGASIESYAFYNCSGLTNITIPDSVTSIGGSAFSGCSSLESITIPFVGGSIKTASDTYQYPFGYMFGTSSYMGGVGIWQHYFGNSTSSTTSSYYYIPSSLKSVTVTGGNILYGAFYNCRSLTSIIIPESVTSIGSYAFNGCSSLTSITIPESVTSIGGGAFYGCDGLTSITIPDGVTSIESHTFYGCDGLTSITIPESVTSIGGSAFWGCSGLISITIPESVTSIENWVFYNCSGLTSITIPDSVTSIGNNAFKDCSGLTSITIPDGVTSIGNSAFSGCSGLTSITIPDSVTSIGSGAFESCGNLTSITIPFVGAGGNDNTHFGYIFGAIRYSYNSDHVPSTLKEVIITGGASIESYAFCNCSGLTSITIPDSVTSIGSSAFANCSSLTSITIPDGVISIERNTFSNCSGLTSITIPDSVTSIGNNAFSDCSGLTSITIPNTVTNIGDYAFENCSGLTSITIPDSVTSIGDGAFLGCSGLTSITIPDSVTSIGEGAFGGCSVLTSITIPDSVTSIEGYTFSGCSGLTSITIPDNVTSIGNNAFSGCSGLTSITIPDNVRGIADSAFNNCSGLTSITVPDSVTSIGNNAFQNCSSLTSITIPNNVTSIGHFAFQNCSSLINIAIPDSVTSIGLYAFSDCSSLTSITIPDRVTSIESFVFEDCSSLTSIIIPDSVTSIGSSAFAGCSSLTNITIPDSVTSIDNYVFGGCSSLTSIIIPDSVTSIGSDAFAGCSGLTIYCEAASKPSGWSSSWNYSNCPVVWGYKGN